MELSARSFHPQQNIEEIQKQAQLRWFSAAEIREIFSNTERLNILIFQRQERPSSGSFFGIKQDMVREFKKDDHNWTKKKDGKTVQETHERLKVGNVEMLQGLYVHGQDNENFQRRIYWMVDKEPSDIALFHYLEAKKNRRRCERTKDLSGELPARSLNKCQMIFQPTMERQNPAANFSEKVRIRFEKLLSRSSIGQKYDHSNIDKLCYKIKPLLKEEDGDWSQMEIKIEVNISSEMVKEKILKEKFHSWLLQKPDSTQFLCVITLRAGAAPVKLSYPTPKYPLSKTPIELASETEPE